MKRYLSLFLASLITQAANASETYVSASTFYKNSECEIFSWLPTQPERTKITYKNKAVKRSNGTYSCEIPIPLQEFEKTFKVCFLSRIAYSREVNHKPHSAEFWGGPANGDNDYYYFNWSDAEYTHAGFICLLR